MFTSEAKRGVACSDLTQTAAEAASSAAFTAYSTNVQLPVSRNKAHITSSMPQTA
jgi:hypothetical protein